MVCAFYHSATCQMPYRASMEMTFELEISSHCAVGMSEIDFRVKQRYCIFLENKIEHRGEEEEEGKKWIETPQFLSEFAIEKWFQKMEITVFIVFFPQFNSLG